MSLITRKLGELRETRDEVLSVEWKIGSLLALSGSAGSVCLSPEFDFSGSTWCLQLYPYGESKDKISESIALYLMRTGYASNSIMTFELGVRKLDGTLYLEKASTRNFEGRACYGYRNFLARSEVLRQKDDLKPSDALTVTCNLKNLPPPTELHPFAANLKNILASKKYSDVTIHVKDRVYEAHKIILAASSVVFSAMFEHEMSESNSGVVSIPDCEPQSFEDFLHFLYTGRTDITNNNVYHLYRTAHKYCVEELKTHCSAFMIKNLSVDNICVVAALGDQYSDFNLNLPCENFFGENIQQILLTSQWKSLLKEHYLLAYKFLKDVAPRITVSK